LPAVSRTVIRASGTILSSSLIAVPASSTVPVSSTSWCRIPLSGTVSVTAIGRYSWPLITSV
jgi:hypothetical protein